MSRTAPNLAKRHDPTVYPTYDNMGASTFELFVRLELVPLVERYLAARGEAAFVGSDQFIYWVQFEPTRSVAPDLYVVPGLAPRTQFDSIKTWQDGRVPSFALEIVSLNKGKDYVHAPLRYAELGVRELVIYDPKASKRRGVGVTWQVYRRLPRRGFVQVEATGGDRVRSKVLGCFLREVRGPHGALEVRLGVGPSGDELVPTEAEEARAAAERERAEKERERAEKERALAEGARERAEREKVLAERAQALAESERERAEKEKALAAGASERAARLEAEAEMARLRALLRRRARR
ncbi:MAG TPA: Uma2 family endonuclease [Polyangiaceae bacterium]|nr:Uma2 family endonuclease [Polyangiaceae bacterium]